MKWVWAPDYSKRVLPTVGYLAASSSRSDEECFNREHWERVRIARAGFRDTAPPIQAPPERKTMPRAVWLAIALVLLCIAIEACGPNYSEGQRVGVVTKISYKGLIFKSWEAEALIALPINVAGQTTPEAFDFNVAPEAVSKVEAAAASGQRVKLVYRQWAIAPPSIQFDHVVFDVQPVK